MSEGNYAMLQEKAFEFKSIETHPRDWRAKEKIFIEQSVYTIKTADTFEEFNEVLKLRKEVFFGEFAKIEGFQDCSDFEERDLDADFLIIKDKGVIIATYRLICSRFSEDFYSKSEFEIDSFLSSKGQKLELSRACVKPGYRASIALHLLWRGIAAYMMATGSRYLFGCSSVQTQDLSDIVMLYRYLKKANALDEQFDISPRHAYHIIDINGIIGLEVPAVEIIDIKSVPPLFLSYLKAGAKVCGAPALDMQFGCIDFFTILDFNSFSNSHLRKYFKSQIRS